ncbi:MAG: hypothetical protein LQ338_002282 [Usnochroma carphineum]|nr:MAG: hypothetical protein LQ338_002282 [Usnochroma carphineum]
MLVHSLILRRLPALLLLAVDSSVAVPPVQGEQLARRQPFSKSHAEDGSQGWAERGAQKPHAEQRAIAVHKMMDDEAEMFFPDYWAFDQKDDDWAFLQSESEDAKLRAHSSHDGSNEADIWANASLFHQFEAPIALHRDTDGTPSYAHWARGLLLHDRAFHCPNGTDDFAVHLEQAASSSLTPATATSHAAAAAKRALEMSNTAPKDTKAAPALPGEAAVYQGTLVWGL